MSIIDLKFSFFSEYLCSLGIRITVASYNDSDSAPLFLFCGIVCTILVLAHGKAESGAKRDNSTGE